ncbi:hypothetical protein MT325_m593L [Paramecium bursaria chlorella virus MT325]|uniref:Uncharacterized protein m593L n=1 Tax=Paramecium bursaria Chlorella virus MT325 TaxID=346932 RepID=A7IUX3_PBCVM|nr:hypothetical protein MT325_m593L [Paramecium bursaria chlorella virus MT325]
MYKMSLLVLTQEFQEEDMPWFGTAFLHPHVPNRGPCPSFHLDNPKNLLWVCEWYTCIYLAWDQDNQYTLGMMHTEIRRIHLPSHDRCLGFPGDTSMCCQLGLS